MKVTELYDEETQEYSDDLKSLSGDIADLTKSAQHPMGVSLFTDETRTEYKSTYQILKDITEVYDELSDRDQAALLEKIAGKRNAQVVAAILNNFDAVDKSIETMQNSAGNAEKEMGVIMDSIEYKTNRLKETAVGIAQDIFQRDSTKNMVDNLTSLLEIINKLTTSIGGLGTAFTGLMAYKGFKGQGIFDIFGAGASGVKGIKNFFTQPVLTKFATNAGLTMADVDALKAFNQQLSQGVTVSRAFEQTMTGSSAAAQSMATSVASGNVAVSQLSVQSRAAAVGMGMLNAAMNVGITLAISWGITQLAKKLDELIVTEEEAKQQHDELIESINSNIDKRNAEQKEIQALIKEYQSYGELTSYTAEQKEQLKNIQDQLIDTYGLEADGIDLVNGKYEEQIKLLDEKARKEAKENNANLWAAYEETKSDYDNNSGYSFKQIFNANSIGTKGKGLFAKDVYEESALKKAFSDVFEETTKITGLHYNNMEKTSSIQTQEITFALRTVDEDGNPLDANAMLEQVLAIQDRIDEIRRDSSQQSLTQSQEFIDLQAQVAKWVEHYRNEVDANNAALNDLAKNIALTTAVNIDGVDYYADTVTSDIYNEYKEKLVEAYSKSEPEVADAITKYLDDTYGKAFAEEAKNVKKSISELYSETYSAIKKEKDPVLTLFEAESYKDKTKEVSKSFSELEEAIKAIDDGDLPDPELLVKFPELSAYTDDVNVLRQAILNLMTNVPNDLIDELSYLRENIDLSVDTLKSALTELGEGGAVDLTNRAVIDTKLLKDAGWDEIEEGIATLYTSTYTNGQSGKKAVAINFTPIVVDENGKYVGVLSPDELDEYAEGVINKTRADDLHLQIGAEFTGKNAEKEASATAEYIHELQEYLYSYSANELTKEEEKQKGLIQGFITLLEKLTGKVKKLNGELTNISASDYIKYEENNIQNIIDKLEKEKDAQNEVLDSLKSQKETLKQTISDYEKVADVVGKYIDRTQIEPLNDRKTEIEEYYNTEIEKLKEENEERSKNIELQEKQDALANARKQKNRVYTETEGWVWKQNNKAIRDAQKDLADLQNTMSIESLEKTRDAEVKNIDEQIKSWEKYKDEWKRQVEQITEADNELMASKVLGVDWQDQVANQSVGIMTAYGNEYASYNNRLKNQVEVEIAQTEKVIDERDKEIEEWKDYKNDISNLNTSIETSNEAYLESLNNLVLDENSTWEDRVNHLKRNVEIIKQLNAEAASANLTQFGSGMYTLYQGDELVGWGYSSAKEAERERRKIAENIAKNRTPQNAPAGVIESIIQSIMNSMHIKKYARGGVNTTTGLSWLDGTQGSSEVVFNAAQAKQLYDIVHSGDFGRMMGENILSGLRDVLGQIKYKNSGQSTPNVLNVSFPNANINAESYESFKGFMDKYTNDLFMQLQTGKK